MGKKEGERERQRQREWCEHNRSHLTAAKVTFP